VTSLGNSMFSRFWQDLSFAVRSLRRTPAFTLTALLVLGFGIGSATAIFTVLNATVLRPLPYADAERLHVIHPVSRAGRRIPSNALHFREWQRANTSFETMALISPDVVTIGAAGEPIRVNSGRTTPSLFPMLGVQPELGRLFAPGDDVDGSDHVIVLSHNLWVHRFGADRSVIGRGVRVDGEPYTVIGVLPATFSFDRLSHLYPLDATGGAPELWAPFVPTARDLRPSGSFNYIAIGRLKPDVTAAQATADVSAVQAELARTLPNLSVSRVQLESMVSQLTSGMRSGVQIAFAAVSTVLVIACINITALFLARSGRRHRELAIRQAVGAQRGQLVAQTLTETIVLAVASAVTGLAVGSALVGGIRRFAPAGVPRLDEVSFDARVFAFVGLTALVSAAIVGFLPALRAAGINSLILLRSSSATATSSTAVGRLRAGLIGAEVAASAACLVAAALLTTSFARLTGIERGFRTDQVVTFDLLLPASYDAARATSFLNRLAEQVRATPGVRTAGITDMLPLSGVSNSGVTVEGAPPSDPGPSAMIRFADRGYFETMGIEVLAGRLLQPSDIGRQVAVVTRLAADRMWPNQNPIGRRFRRGGNDTPLIEVVGIVEDVRGVSLKEAPPLTIYVPVPENYYGVASLAISTAAEPPAMTSTVKSIVQSLDSQIAVPTPRTMEQIVSSSVAVARFEMVLVLLLAIAAALLTAVGIYGVMAQSVAQRTAEFGVRLAVGAKPFDIVRLVLTSLLRPVLGGLAVGLVAAGLLGRFMSGLLFGVTPADPISFLAVSMLIVTTAVIAALVPLRRSMKVEPIAALRTE
jgi:predicted permease